MQAVKAHYDSSFILEVLYKKFTKLMIWDNLSEWKGLKSY